VTYLEKTNMVNLALIEESMKQPTVNEQTDKILIKAKPKDKEILARTIYGEASNQGEEGMIAVGNVILNRYNSNLPKYKTKNIEGITGVVLKPYAFTVYNDKKNENYNRMINATKEDKTYAKALDIAEKLLTGKIKDNTDGATHYFNPDEADPYWKDSPLMTPLKKIGNHSFYLEAN
tara:strand:+ start:1311 stop:1841 length:531 start_codon:yes stop_codon:yes gene_type:complete